MALCVGNQFRGQGIGRALIQKIETVAREMCCIKISVASGVHRIEAHRFYTGLGYEEITKRFVKNLD
jgi:GNAT superfamily N-acetyltransferase